MEENCSIACRITSDNEFTLEKRVKCIQKLYHKKTQLIQPLSKSIGSQPTSGAADEKKIFDHTKKDKF